MKKIIALLMVIVSAVSANATLITFQEGVNGYAGNRDTELRYPEPDLNSSDAASISIDYDDGPGSVNPTHGLLAFDNIIGNGLNQIPAGSIINSATLTVVIESVGSGWTFNRMLMNWDENTATWNSFGSGIQANGIESAATPTFSDGLGDGNGNVYGDADSQYIAILTADVQAWTNGAVNYGWAILPFEGGTNGIDFASSEGWITDRPVLTVDYTVPEPTTMALLGLGGLIFARKRNV